MESSQQRSCRGNRASLTLATCPDHLRRCFITRYREKSVGAWTQPCFRPDQKGNSSVSLLSWNTRQDILPCSARIRPHPSQNVPAAGYLAADNAISAAYFEFTLVRLVFRMRLFELLFITTFRLHTASLHPFSGYKVSSEPPVQIVTKKYTT